MRILGIESSCDECSAAVVEDGRRILSNIVLSQVDFHKPFYGVVPEIASRKHIEWIGPVVQQALSEAGVAVDDIDVVAVTFRPGLIGSLLVGLSFAKGLAWALGKPLIGVDHILAHLYAPHLEREIRYPYLGVLVSGGHTIIARVDRHDRMQVLGTTIDDACGEAFDKVAKYYGIGFPGGVAIDKLSQTGNSRAFRFPRPVLNKGEAFYDVSYSGLKTAVIHQIDQFWDGVSEKNLANIAASFQRTAVDILVDKALAAARDSDLSRIVAGGGVAANSYLRRRLASEEGLEVIFPSLALCTDNAAMVAGLGYHLFCDGAVSDFTLNAEARVPVFKRSYP
ncbi:MAG TPA: tRNA (adenosine(37)-N6)-threonylcarbamoyltransferase complex transferase subunit TsaD [Spirochaetia bacterium]|nr:tRNA (adenosine(37)-N6)-threonylcarbamoyltransferase complex transferase subunit TsaD [Spirochaetia bacterium]